MQSRTLEPSRIGTLHDFMSTVLEVPCICCQLMTSTASRNHEELGVTHPCDLSGDGHCITLDLPARSVYPEQISGHIPTGSL